MHTEAAIIVCASSGMVNFVQGCPMGLKELQHKDNILNFELYVTLLRDVRDRRLHDENVRS